MSIELQPIDITKVTNKTEAENAIANLMTQAELLVSECEQLADKFECEFSCDLGGYGMGGWYESGEWRASSHSC